MHRQRMSTTRLRPPSNLSRSPHLSAQLFTIMIEWPPKPTVVAPAKLQATVAAIVKVLSAAQIEYAAPRLRGRDAEDASSKIITWR
jgi:hypothetical protein